MRSCALRASRCLAFRTLRVSRRTTPSIRSCNSGHCSSERIAIWNRRRRVSRWSSAGRYLIAGEGTKVPRHEPADRRGGDGALPDIGFAARRVRRSERQQKKRIDLAGQRAQAGAAGAQFGEPTGAAARCAEQQYHSELPLQKSASASASSRPAISPAPKNGPIAHAHHASTHGFEFSRRLSCGRSWSALCFLDRKFAVWRRLRRGAARPQHRDRGAALRHVHQLLS